MLGLVLVRYRSLSMRRWYEVISCKGAPFFKILFDVFNHGCRTRFFYKQAKISENIKGIFSL